MKPEDINRIIALDRGWKWKYSRAKLELRWYSPIGENYLQPPDYLNNEDLMESILNELSNNDLRKAIRGSHGGNLAIAYVKFLSEKS